MRRTGPDDISYCCTKCLRQNCKRNLHFWKAPSKIYSVSNFDSDCADELHPNCKYKWVAREDKNE